VRRYHVPRRGFVDFEAVGGVADLLRGGLDAGGVFIHGVFVAHAGGLRIVLGFAEAAGEDLGRVAGLSRRCGGGL
jgi:hypothetical protein